MHWLEHGGKITLRVKIRRRCHTDCARYSRTEVRENVSEEVTAHDNVEIVWRHHEPGGQDVDMELIGADVRKLFCDLSETLVPVGHRVIDAVGFRRGSHML